MLRFHRFRLFSVGVTKVYMAFGVWWFYLLEPIVFMG